MACGGSRGRASVARLLFFFFSGLLAGCATAASDPPAAEAPPPEPQPAYYTAEQATRGQRVFASVCAVCHGRNEFTGPIFELTWMAEPLGSLFDHVSTAMPQDDPGSLTPQQYADVVAYMLQLNRRRPGERELPADAAVLRWLRW